MRSGHRAALVGMGTLAMALSFLARQTLSVLAPTVCAGLGLSNAQYGFTGSAFALTLLVATPLAGLYLDKAGVRRGLALAVVAWAAAAAAHGLAAGLVSLLVARAALGLAEAPAFPGSAHVVRSVCAPEQVGRGIGFVLSGSTLGALAALFVAVPLQQKFGWRGAFAGVGLISALWVPLWLWLSSGTEALRVSPARSTAGGFLQPPVAGAVLFTLGASPALAFANLWWPKFLVARHGIAQSEVAFYGFLLPVAYDAGAIALGDLAGRSGRQRQVLVAAAALALLVAAIPFARGPWAAVALAAAAFSGVGGAFAISTAAALAAVDRDSVSRAGALVATANSLGFVLWNPAIGWSVDRTGSFSPALIFAAVALAAGTAAWLRRPVPV